MAESPASFHPATPAHPFASRPLPAVLLHSIGDRETRGAADPYGLRTSHRHPGKIVIPAKAGIHRAAAEAIGKEARHRRRFKDRMPYRWRDGSRPSPG